MHGHCRQVVVQWTTRDVGSPVAQVGTTSGTYTQTAVAVTNTYPRSEMVGPPGNSFGYFDPVSQTFTSHPRMRAITASTPGFHANFYS